MVLVECDTKDIHGGGVVFAVVRLYTPQEKHIHKSVTVSQMRAFQLSKKRNMLMGSASDILSLFHKQCPFHWSMGMNLTPTSFYVI